MCNVVIIGDAEISTIGELRRALGSDNVVIREGYRLEGLDACCLCPVKIPASALHAGYAASKNEWGEWTLERKQR